MKYPNGRFKPKPCRWCDEVFVPEAPSHHYCDDPCKEKAYDDAYYRRSYGVGYEEVEAMRGEQDNKCALCGEIGFLMREHHRQTLVVDHSHATGAVRGLLCHNCNRALGLFKDRPDVLRLAADYVEKGREGATTIPKGSRDQAVSKRTAPKGVMI